MKIEDLNTTGFKEGEQILFCPHCTWQAHGPEARSPICPGCVTRLTIVTMTDELAKMTGNANYLSKSEQNENKKTINSNNSEK